MLDASFPAKMMEQHLASHYPLTPSERIRISDLPCTIRTLEPSAYLVREGETPVHCSILLTGFAYRQKVTGDGSRQIVALQVPGDMLDLQHLFLGTADHDVLALTKMDVALIPRAALRETALETPAIAQAVMRSLMIDGSMLREWMLNIGRRDARSRLAHLLCEFAIRLDTRGLNTGTGYNLPMTQEQLADALGLTPVHVHRMLKSLAEAGLITRNRRDVSFPHWEALRTVADFSDRYLHLQSDN